MRILSVPRENVSRRGQRTRWAPIAEALRRLLARGRLQPGELLPSTRQLALSYGVHRQTIMVALDALCAEGLLHAEPRRGYRVAEPEPVLAVNPVRSPARPFQFRLASTPSAPWAALDGLQYPLHAATPDPTLLPLRELRAAYAHVLGRQGAATLDVREPWGHPALRRELAAYLRRARALIPERLLLTCGSQEGIQLVARALLQPGDAVAVEDPGYFPAWSAFRAAGAEPCGVPVDEHGIRVDALARLLGQRRVRLVYVTPQHQYPTTVTLSAPRRRALIELTLAAGVPILEDDYDHEYHFRGEPQAPLAASRDAPHVIYVASLSKLVAPGVRVGMLCGSAALLEQLAAQREHSLGGGDALTQAALADWIADGGFERHVRRARRIYAERRAAALDSLAGAARLGPVELTAPDGGLALWTRWAVPCAELARRALARGVAVLPGTLASLHGETQGLRLAYSRVSPEAFGRAIRILVAEARRR